LARSNKNFEVKKQEIIEAALHLFIKNGYENTTTNDIIEMSDISRGAMYHYFNSKEDILKAVINYTIELDYGKLEMIINDEHISAIEKLNALIAGTNNKPESVALAVDYAKRNTNSIFDYISRELSFKRSVPDIAKIIKQGIEEDVFHTEYPDEMAEFYYMLARSLFDISSETNYEQQIKRIDAFIYLMEKGLGTHYGELDTIKNTCYLAFTK